MKKLIIILIALQCISLYCKRDQNYVGNSYMEIDEKNDRRFYYVNNIDYNASYYDDLLSIELGIIIKNDDSILKVKKLNVNLICNGEEVINIDNKIYSCFYDFYISNIPMKISGYSFPPFRKNRELSGNYYMTYVKNSIFYIEKEEMKDTTINVEYEYQLLDGVTKGSFSMPLLDFDSLSQYK